MNQPSAPDNTVAQRIPCSVANNDNDGAKKAIQEWMELPQNRDFVSKHAWIEKWQSDDGGKAIIAYFKKTGDGFDDGADKPGGKRASPLRNGGTYTNYMRSTNYTTGYPGPSTLPPPPSAGPSQGLWRSYHAQQRDASRERELSANAERYRRTHYENAYRVEGSPIRSHSP